LIIGKIGIPGCVVGGAAGRSANDQENTNYVNSKYHGNRVTWRLMWPGRLLCLGFIPGETGIDRF